MGPHLSWVPDEFNGLGKTAEAAGGNRGVPCGSLNDHSWTVVGSDSTAASRSTSGVALVNDAGGSRVTVRPILVEVSDIKSFRLSDDGNRLTLIQNDGTKYPPLIFLDEGPESLISVFQKYMKVRQSATDPNLFLLTDARVDALDASLSQLNLFDKSHTDVLWKAIHDLKKEPYVTTMSIFSKITDKLIFGNLDEDVRPDDETADLLTNSSHLNGSSNQVGLHVTTAQGEDGEFEVVTPRQKLLDNLLNGEGSSSLERSEALCQLDWELHFDDRGRIMDLDVLKEKIFRGGVEEVIRNEVWKFLLGYYDWTMDEEERGRHREAKVKDYHRMKLHWKSISEDQEARFSGFRDRKSQIEKDVGRTDRNHPFFEGDNNPNVKLLEEILLTYVMYNFDLGYVQGMSDLLAPILFVMDGNEVDAFWCFVGFMDRVKANFDFDQGGIKQQLTDLAELVKLLDPDLYAYLDTRESVNFIFCFRWLLIWFKRELAFTDVMRLWEVLWTRKPCTNFHLLICVALINDQTATIVENKFGYSEILKHINDLANRINLNDVLIKAEAIWLKIREASSPVSNEATTVHVSNSVRAIVGLPPVSRPPSTLSDDARPRRLTSNRQPSGSSIEVIDDGQDSIAGGDGCGPRRSNPIPVRSAAAARDDPHVSSSVEVISPINDDNETKFQQNLSNFY